MANKEVVKPSAGDLDSARQEAMRIRFRRVLGENVSAHVIKNARKNIAKCVRLLQNKEDKNA